MEYKTYQYQSFFEEIKDKHGKPDYAIGVTFGVDLDKWRSINKTLFGRDFSEKSVFERSFLFTDKVYIKDTNPNRDLYNGNLRFAIPDVSGYLHTKFVLLCYKDKYVLVLSTKNINGNSSYDCILPLVFTQSEKNGAEGSDGKRVRDYLDYLTERSKDHPIPEDLKRHTEKLDKYRITSSIDGFDVGLFEFAYGTKRFSPEMTDKIYRSKKIVSPYLDDDSISAITNDAGDTQVLTYPEQIEKITDKGKVRFRVGIGEYRDGYLIDRRKYHAKIYFNWDEKENRGYMIVGSANLTAAAANNHCEMLVEFISKNEEAYRMREAFFDDEAWTEVYDPNKDYSVLTDNDDDIDDEAPAPVVDNDSKIYVSMEEAADTEMFTAHIVKKSGEDILWGDPYSDAGYFVVFGQQMLHVDKSRYVSDEEIAKYEGALPFGEYERLIDRRKAELQKESDKSVLTGKRQSSVTGTKTGSNSNGNSVVTEDIPCLFDTLFRNLETRRTKNKSKDNTVTVEMIKEELTNIRNSLFNKEWIEQIDKMLEDLETENE